MTANVGLLIFLYLIRKQCSRSQNRLTVRKKSKTKIHMMVYPNQLVPRVHHRQCLFVLFFETVSLCSSTVLAVLELALQTRMASNSETGLPLLPQC